LGGLGGLFGGATPAKYPVVTGLSEYDSDIMPLQAQVWNALHAIVS